MNRVHLLAVTLIALPMYWAAGNPFLDAADDLAVKAKFTGTEWGDEIKGDESPLSVSVVTKRIAKMSWGAVYEVRFDQVQSRTTPARKIAPEYFVVTDDRIYLLNEEDNLAAAQRLEKLNAPPEFGKDAVYAIGSGSFTHADGPWETTITVKGDTCIYSSSHNSGHFKKLAWKRRVGLVEYSSGSGARADGFRLKRVTR